MSINSKTILKRAITNAKALHGVTRVVMIIYITVLTAKDEIRIIY